MLDRVSFSATSQSARRSASHAVMTACVASVALCGLPVAASCASQPALSPDPAPAHSGPRPDPAPVNASRASPSPAAKIAPAPSTPRRCRERGDPTGHDDHCLAARRRGRADHAIPAPQVEPARRAHRRPAATTARSVAILRAIALPRIARRRLRRQRRPRRGHARARRARAARPGARQRGAAQPDRADAPRDGARLGGRELEGTRPQPAAPDLRRARCCPRRRRWPTRPSSPPSSSAPRVRTAGSRAT